MTYEDKAFDLGSKLALEGHDLRASLDRCPYSTVRLRNAFIAGWKSVAEK